QSCTTPILFLLPDTAHGRYGGSQVTPERCWWLLQVRSIYSDYYLSENGTLSFDQVPYFLVADRLSLEKDQMLAEKEMWRSELLERQVRRMVIYGIKSLVIFVL
ncbi:MAG: hypothetical protein MI674_02270, partial [Cytophagales bacterium]|nr:hypothetical protein [Cytophagales bacterium]